MEEIHDETEEITRYLYLLFSGLRLYLGLGF
jgi:hypothetical protein